MHAAASRLGELLLCRTAPHLLVCWGILRLLVIAGTPQPFQPLVALAITLQAIAHDIISYAGACGDQAKTYGQGHAVVAHHDSSRCPAL
jgi:hypothetical protein